MTTATITYALSWTSADQQGSIPMGTYDTPEEAEAAIDQAQAVLLGHCADDEQRADIEAGSWDIEPMRRFRRLPS